MKKKRNHTFLGKKIDQGRNFVLSSLNLMFLWEMEQSYIQVFLVISTGCEYFPG